MPKPSDYGEYYWCVILADGKEAIYAWADRAVIVNTTGALVLLRRKPYEGKGLVSGVPIQVSGTEELITNMAFAPGSWKMVHSASILDGGAPFVEHWDKEE